MVATLRLRNPASHLHPTTIGKSFFSLELQVICDADCRFTDVFLGFPGSAPPARVLRERSFFGDAAQKCSKDDIRGDAAYSLLAWLTPPYKGDQATFQKCEEDFNNCVAVENAFGILKERFRQLYFMNAETIDQSCHIILGGCCNNQCYNSRDNTDDFSGLESNEECEDEHDGAF